MSQPRADRTSVPSGSVDLTADVLVIGGGPAGTWAACSAAWRGASVVLVDKGYCGTSAQQPRRAPASGTYRPIRQSVRPRWRAGRRWAAYLQDRRWMQRVLDRTYESVNLLAEWGYPFPTDDTGQSRRTSLQGPEYMRLMRRRVSHAGVTILDHSPALELLIDGGGAVAGAAGVRRQHNDTWVVRAKAVVIATGGCAFQSKAFGCNVLTGDGYLMAAEAGAELSGMEFSNAYAICARFCVGHENAVLQMGDLHLRDGTEIPGAKSQGGRSAIARALLTQQVYAQIDKADAEQRDGDAPGATELLRAVRPQGRRPVQRTLPSDLAPGRNGTGHRRPSPGR